MDQKVCKSCEKILPKSSYSKSQYKYPDNRRRCNSCVTGTTTTILPIVKETCPICMENFGSSNYCITPCSHKFCLDCYIKHTQFKSNCPLCRGSIPSFEKPETSLDHLGHRGHALPSRLFNLLPMRIENMSECTYYIYWVLPDEVNGVPSRWRDAALMGEVYAGERFSFRVGNIGDSFIFTKNPITRHDLPRGEREIRSDRTYTIFSNTVDTYYIITTGSGDGAIRTNPP